MRTTVTFREGDDALTKADVTVGVCKNLETGADITITDFAGDAANKLVNLGTGSYRLVLPEVTVPAYIEVSLVATPPDVVYYGTMEESVVEEIRKEGRRDYVSLGDCTGIDAGATYFFVDDGSVFPTQSIATWEHESVSGVRTVISEKAAGDEIFLTTVAGQNPSLLGPGLLRYNYYRNGELPAVDLPSRAAICMVYGSGGNGGVDRYFYVKLPADGFADNPVQHPLSFNDYSCYFTADGTPYYVDGGSARPEQHVQDLLFTPTEISEQIRVTDGLEALVTEARDNAEQAYSYAASLYRTFPSQTTDLLATFSGVIPSDGSAITLLARRTNPDSGNFALGVITSDGFVKDIGWNGESIGGWLIGVGASANVPDGVVTLTPDAGGPINVTVSANGIAISAGLVLRDGTISRDDWGSGAFEALEASAGMTEEQYNTIHRKLRNIEARR